MIKAIPDYVLYLRAFLALVMRSRISVPSQVTTILVFQNMKMGDMVCTTPLFRAIKKYMPQARVIVVGDAINKELLQGHPDVDRYIVAPEGEHGSIIRELKTEQIDIGLLPGPNARGLAMLAIAGAHAIVVPVIKNGWSPLETKAYKVLCRFVITVPHTMGAYAPREYLRLLEPLHLYEEDTKKVVAVAEHAKDHADQLLKSLPRPIIGVAPGAGNKVKEWSPGKFAEFVNQLRETSHVSVVIIGGSRDQREGEELFGSLKTHGQTLNTINQLSLEELKAVIGKLDLFVSADTGPIYIAEALGVPTVDIVGPVDEREQPPSGRNHVIVLPPGPRTPILHVMNARVYDEKEAVRQAESTEVTAVVRAAKRLLKLPISS